MKKENNEIMSTGAYMKKAIGTSVLYLFLVLYGGNFISNIYISRYLFAIITGLFVTFSTVKSYAKRVSKSDKESL